MIFPPDTRLWLVAEQAVDFFQVVSHKHDVFFRSTRWKMLLTGLLLQKQRLGTLLKAVHGQHVVSGRKPGTFDRCSGLRMLVDPGHHLSDGLRPLLLVELRHTF